MPRKRHQKGKGLMKTRPMHDYERGHYAAWAAPKAGMENAIRDMVRGWREYADTHKEQYDSDICDDCYLGDEWVDMGLALRALLNGETGRFDCGTLDALIVQTLRSNGYTEVL